ncbi:MerR family transcriptional regulator [Rossellomorea vietnamensis]|uniref:MerR family transcriptional regulator n=1 Tax=Rossellomorea vietnamensis TaxID=218284 RepID=UPI001E5F6622|nr:MerR family transcriptional regulator [Rossellomorea vietnamensis]MCC5801231.1 MerR family transcriptional regulator [Rossellomorea vietnamensis]
MNLRVYRGIEITRPFNLSADLLRKYETWGFIPHAPRGRNNYRQYTELHKRFFEASRHMMAGYSWTEVAKMMRHLVNKEREAAIILAVEFQAELVKNYKESTLVIEQLQSTLSNQEISPKVQVDRHVTYKEVSKRLSLPISTLRVWEQQELFEASRGENNYRYFDGALMNKLFIIKLLRLSGMGFDQCRDVLKGIERKNYRDILPILQGRIVDMREQMNKGLKSLGTLNELVTYLEGVNYFSDLSKER